MKNLGQKDMKCLMYDAAIFGLFKVAKSYGFLEDVGYFYNWEIPHSSTHKYNNLNILIIKRIENINNISKTIS